MEEMLGPLGGGDPTEPLFVLYKEWAKGTWGMILTGEALARSSFTAAEPIAGLIGSAFSF